ALRRLHDDPALRRRLAENGRAEALRSYSNEVIGELLDARVRELIAGARPQARMDHA
ncbi:MAG: glycosyltransferase family 4 protein, partial [Thauera phenolivorans]|nr:glycosyltransferase family 4 protein [Thauera phenolivorans]